MFRKIMFAFAAAVAASFASTAFAYETPENKIGDKYPLLEQRYVAQVSGHNAYAQASKGNVTYERAWALCKKEIGSSVPRSDTTTSSARHTAGGACMARYGYRL